MKAKEKTREERLAEMRSLHDKIKEHPYWMTFDINLFEDVRKDFRELSRCVWNSADDKNPYYVILRCVTHDFNCMLSNIPYWVKEGKFDEIRDEIAAIKEAIHPHETLFVVDSMTGQDAVNTAKEFNDRLDFDGVVLTKLDGDTRGGAALSIRTVVNKPIKYIGSGEKLEDLQEFNPEGMASRILGMGDIVEIAKRAQEIYDQKEAERLQEKIKKNKFDFDDFLKQIQQIKKMGNLKELASMIPGVGKAIKDIDIDDNAFKGIEAIINSMTPEERRRPEIINGSRRQRIARGSGTNIVDVNRLLKQFEETRKMMHMATTMKNPMKMMKQMKAQGRRR